jgi:hypothetical protein
VKPPHAFVPFHGFTVPLIGVRHTEALEECDYCGDLFGLSTILLTGTQFLCHKCNLPSTAHAHTSPNVRPH